MRPVRLPAIMLAAIAIAGCDSGTVPPPGQRTTTDEGAEVAFDEIVLRGDGLAAGSESFYFSAGENEVDAAVEKIAGKAIGRTENGGCGSGPLSLVTYPDGLTANYQDGRLVGWTLMSQSESIRVEGDLEFGANVDDARAADGFVMLEPTALGQEFALGSDIGGFVSDGTVTVLYAGSQCFSR